MAQIYVLKKNHGGLFVGLSSDVLVFIQTRQLPVDLPCLLGPLRMSFFSVKHIQVVLTVPVHSVRVWSSGTSVCQE
jgi:hypothetical protein